MKQTITKTCLALALIPMICAAASGTKPRSLGQFALKVTNKMNRPIEIQNLSTSASAPKGARIDAGHTVYFLRYPIDEVLFTTLAPVALVDNATGRPTTKNIPQPISILFAQGKISPHAIIIQGTPEKMSISAQAFTSKDGHEDEVDAVIGIEAPIVPAGYTLAPLQESDGFFGASFF